MLSVWNQVKVINKDHARLDQAGVVHAVGHKNPDAVVVQFDVDGIREAVAVADLQVLA